MVSFDFLSKPIELNSDSVSVLCIENKKLYRDTVSAVINSCFDNVKIVFSCDYIPIDYNKNIASIYDYYSFEFPSSFIKRIYEDISDFCSVELQKELLNFISAREILFDKIVSEYDFDFEYSNNVPLQNEFKALNLKPTLAKNSILDSLTEYILLLNKYSNIKCFVLINLHLYFSNEEVSSFYKDMQYNGISILDIENNKLFPSLSKEKVIIIDEDLCEIIDF